uniref:Uncharacterized protein n=1 Tax=viral metagenome TaxID=1070528 RepID=A0A6C0BPG7_9ZZZZ
MGRLLRKLLSIFICGSCCFGNTSSIDEEVRPTTQIEKNENIVQAPKEQFTYVKQRSGFSKKAIRWLDSISEKEGINIRHAGNVGELKIPYIDEKGKHRWFFADGFCEENNTVYEFHGDYYHGNPRVYARDMMNTKCQKTMGQLYDDTIAREKIIKEKFNLVVMWELDFRE